MSELNEIEKVENYQDGNNLIGQINVLCEEIVDALALEPNKLFHGELVYEKIAKYLTPISVTQNISVEAKESIGNVTEDDYFNHLAQNAFPKISEGIVNQGKFQRIDTEAPMGTEHLITVYAFGMQDS